VSSADQAAPTLTDGGFALLMQSIISHSPIGVAVIDFDGLYRSVNPSYCRLYAYAESELIGQSFTMVFPVAQRALILRRHQQFLATGGELKGEFDVVRRDRAPLAIVSESVRLPSADGRGLRLVYVVDITQRRQMEAALRASEETYRTLFETVPQGIVYHDLRGRITAANPAAVRMLGLPLEQLLERSRRDPRWRLIRPDGVPFRYAEHPYAIALRTREAVRSVPMGIETPGRDTRWILVNAIPQFRGGVLDCVYSCFEDVTERFERDAALTREAATDFLTGVANRRAVMDRLCYERARLARQPEQRCSLLAVDLDEFKRVNDEWGHAAGDAVLRHTTQLMLAQVRSTDLVGRVGGEEFAVILPDAGRDSAGVLAERLRASVEGTPTPFDGRALTVTISIGITEIRAADSGSADALERADRALYEAKNAGRNRVRAQA